MFSTEQLGISKCTWIKCLLETNLASSVKPINVGVTSKKYTWSILELYFTYIEDIPWLIYQDIAYSVLKFSAAS